jgi:hypothetical protein
MADGKPWERYAGSSTGKPWEKYAVSTPEPQAQAASGPTPEKDLSILGKVARQIDPVQFLGGAATGAAAAIPGFPGDVEALMHTVLPMPGAPSIFPTSERIGTAVAGQPKTLAARIGRDVGGVLGPPAMVTAGKAAGPAIGKVASEVMGLTSGTGAAPIEEAYKAGKAGGAAAKAFLDNITQKAPIENVVDTARNAVDAMKVERQAAYKAGLTSAIGGKTQPLNFAPIDAALQKTSNIGLDSSGTIEIIPGARQVHKAISDVIAQFRSNPSLRTPENFDDMKKAINNLQYHGELKNIAGPGTPGSIIVREARDAISKEIATQAPDYAKVMKAYGDASDALDEMTRSLSLGEKSTYDTALRKLQSVMRNNVQTSYGYRTKLADELNKRAGGTLTPALAGQALSEWAPRGLARYVAGGEIAGAMHDPWFLAGVPLSSPRLVGNTAYQLGKISRYATPQNAFYAALASQAPNWATAPTPPAPGR